MKFLAAFALLLILPLQADEKGLSEVDRQLLLERLEEIKNSSDATINGRLRVALAAFRNGRASDAAAHDLYLNCVEKIRFEDQLRKTSEFRDWKKRHKERGDTPAFRLALRHQLDWLTLTLEAAQAKADTNFGSRAMAVVDSILQDAEKLKGQEKLLKANSLQTVFAQAYSVNTVSVAKWPTNPLNLDSLYDNVILPPLRDEKTLPILRKAWLKRIEQEGLLLEKWTDTGTSDRDRKPDFEKWLKEERKDLLWNMEVDLFRSGDQKGSAVRMLQHLKENLTHKSAPRWIGQFTSLVEAGSIVPPVAIEESNTED